MAEPEGQAHGDRRRGAADPVVGPRGLAHPERRHARHRGHRPVRRPVAGRDHEAELPEHPLRVGDGHRLLRPEGGGPERRSDRMVRGRERRRAVRLEPLRALAVARDRPEPLGVLPEDERAARAHADLERLHGRPVPGRRGRALREQGAGQVPARAHRAAALRLRAPARSGQGGRRGAPLEAHARLVRPLREGRAGEGPARRRGAHPDLPARRAVRRPVPRLELGRPQPGRGALLVGGGSHRALELGQPGGLARDRPDHGSGRLRLHAGRRRGRDGHLPAAGGTRRRIHPARLAGRERPLRGHRPRPRGGDPALGRGPRRRHPDARGTRAAAAPQGQPPGLPAAPERLALRRRPRAEARARGPRLPVRPPLELRLVDRRSRTSRCAYRCTTSRAA